MRILYNGKCWIVLAVVSEYGVALIAESSSVRISHSRCQMPDVAAFIFLTQIFQNIWYSNISFSNISQYSIFKYFTIQPYHIYEVTLSLSFREKVTLCCIWKLELGVGFFLQLIHIHCVIDCGRSILAHFWIKIGNFLTASKIGAIG